MELSRKFTTYRHCMSQVQYACLCMLYKMVALDTQKWLKRKTAILLQAVHRELALYSVSYFIVMFNTWCFL